MLLYFKTANNLSFDEEVEFSMVAGSYTELPQNTVYLEKQKVSVVKSAAIFGANASGKTNLIKCMGFGIDFISNDLYVYHPNLNKQINKEKPTTYTYGILLDGIQFEYFFCISKERVIEEKLIEYKTQKPTTHYHRKYNLETKEYEWSKLSSALKDKRTMLSEIQEVLPEKSLYLNRISQFEIPIMKNVFNFFKIKILTFNKYELDSIDTNLNQMLLQKIMDNTYFKSVIMNGLKKADFMIEDIEVIERINGSDKSFELITYHKSINEDGSNVKEKFDFNVNESTGTQKFLLALAFVWSLIQIGGYLIFDELDNSLHTHLLQYLISMVHDPKINKKNGQLIFTTHDTNLLNQDLLRRDQIWFAERDELGNSKLIPLSDYKVKKGINLENSYLQGVYGGIPNLEK